MNQWVGVLRKVLDDDPRQPDYIATLLGRGYSRTSRANSDPICSTL
jgi:DNA-binding winged helix-turn-helix (wHTH) protein